MTKRKNRSPTSPTNPNGTIAWQVITSQVQPAPEPLRITSTTDITTRDNASGVFQGTTKTVSNILPPGCFITVHNIVATFNQNCLLDLKQLALHARNTTYNPKRFAACVIRIRNPKATALVFSNGRTVVTGAKTVYESRLAARKFTRIVQKIGYAPTFTDFKVQNVVATCAVFDMEKWYIRLEGFAKKWMLWASWEPEVFAGCVFRMEVPKLVMLIFQNGKIVITGGKSVEDVHRAFEKIYPVLTEFRVEKPEGMMREAKRREEIERRRRESRDTALIK